MDKMPCSISDGYQTPEDVPEYVEEDGDAIRDEQLTFDALKPITVEVEKISPNTLKELGLEDSFQEEFMRKEQAE